ncbi:hypothetical protein SLE2022_338070 [Rubroshorea leprosula]
MEPLADESPSSSPPTPPSPLPISVGPGNQKYLFSPSPSPSPPFSPPTSAHASADSLPLLPQTQKQRQQLPSPFSLDKKPPDNLDDDKTCCLKDL